MANLDLGKVVGSNLHRVTGVPAASLGLEGDWALDPDSGKFYQRTATGWTDWGSFKGAQGPKGDAGEQGPKGDTGEAGADGADGKTPVLSIDAQGHLIATYSE